jgi:hypothetical protein
VIYYNTNEGPEGYTVENVLGDGLCLFRSILGQLSGNDHLKNDQKEKTKIYFNEYIFDLYKFYMNIMYYNESVKYKDPKNHYDGKYFRDDYNWLYDVIINVVMKKHIEKFFVKYFLENQNVWGDTYIAYLISAKEKLIIMQHVKLENGNDYIQQIGPEDANIDDQKLQILSQHVDETYTIIHIVHQNNSHYSILIPNEKLT